MNGKRNDVFFAVCGDYEAALEPAFDWLLDKTGWLRKNWSGCKVLIKPNLLTDRPPEQAVTTHPEVLRLVIRRWKAMGAVLRVGDSPASTANLKAVLATSGIGAVCEQEGVPFVPFEQTRVQNFSRDGFSFSLSGAVTEADFILNLPKVKSHSLTKLTAAVKNLYGAVPGYAKTTLHRLYPKPAVFGKLLQAIWSELPPVYTLADGVVGMEGQGPANGRPIQLGFLAAAENAFALDTALCDLLHISPRGVPYLQGMHDIKPILHGDAVSVPAFEVPSGAHLLSLLPEWLMKSAGRVIWIRPAFDTTRCIGCGQCVKACPVGALALSPARKPQVDIRKCISCACCHEICPKGAIRMTQSPLLRLSRVFKGMD